MFIGNVQCWGATEKLHIVLICLKAYSGVGLTTEKLTMKGEEIKLRRNPLLFYIIMGSKIDKNEILKIVTNAAKLYKDNLCYNDVLFVYKSGDEFNYIETTFKPENFLHLTGLEYLSQSQSAKEFFRKCYKHRIRISEFKIKNGSYYYYKFDIMVSLMNIHKNAKMIGVYNNNRFNLKVDKLTGGIYGFMGFKLINNNKYCPVTIIKDDIRQNVNHYDAIVAILKKHYKDVYYTNVTYFKKNLSIDEVVRSINLKNDIIRLEK